MQFLAILQQLTDEQNQQLLAWTMVAVQLFKIVWVALLKRPKPTEDQLRLVVFLGSIPIAVSLVGISLPATSDPVEFAQAAAVLGLAVLAQTYVIYEVAIKSVLRLIDRPIVARNAGKPLLAP